MAHNYYMRYSLIGSQFIHARFEQWLALFARKKADMALMPEMK